MNITGQVTVQDFLTEVFSVGALSPSSGQLGLTPNAAGFNSPTYNFTNGTSTTGTVAGVIDLHWESGAVVLASAGSNTYTLSALTDALGRTVAFARIRVAILMITSKTLSSNDSLTWGNAALHAWVAWGGGTTPTLTVRDSLLIVDNSPAALPVVAATTDQLKIANAGANSITYQLIFGGNST